MTITLNAFSFARETLRERNIPCINAPHVLDDGLSAQELIDRLGFAAGEIEGVFVNGRIVPKSTRLHDGDRVALLPPGTPGSYRLILGIKAMNDEGASSG